MKKNIYAILLAFVASFALMSCSDDDPSSESIFPTTSPKRDAFDKWLLENYTFPYNVEMKYKMEDIESDMKYHLVPADSAKTAKLSIIMKYLWFDAYNEVVGPDFIKENMPRTIHFIGSPAYNSEGTMVLGTAEGGLKITLYMVNSLDDETLKDYDTMNKYYFHTLHHEFTHILNQKIPYDQSYKLITESGYVSGDWYLISDKTAHQAGFITPYAMVEPLEDFAEMLSGYVTKSQSEWNAILADAGTTGAASISAKLDIVRNYMQESWNVDIDQLRAAVLRRANTLSAVDLEHLN
ncbi:MAG: putative zinc-binding metallopeptidase [Prevotella sp.]|nr:putative zinc-binding metallopeptidase [Prevotella sp.]